MTTQSDNSRRIVIACGGTGGHLFPGLAVADELRRSGHQVMLCLSNRELDRQLIQDWPEDSVIYLPAIGLSWRHLVSSLQSYVTAYRKVRARFQEFHPQLVLSMGGFTGAPVLLAGRRCRAITALHESNVIPGRANRLLSSRVNAAFVQFEETYPRLRTRFIQTTGMPVRAAFENLPDQAECREALGLKADLPVLLVMGGSQGASGINDRMLETLPLLSKDAERFQILHLTGPRDHERVRRACKDYPGHAVVHDFLHSMHLALGAATAVISRAGASTIAECAAAGKAALLIPFPHATDDHQTVNAAVLQERGASRWMAQSDALPGRLATEIQSLLFNDSFRSELEHAMRGFHHPGAAGQLAKALIGLIDHRPSGDHSDRPFAGSEVSQPSSQSITETKSGANSPTGVTSCTR